MKYNIRLHVIGDTLEDIEKDLKIMIEDIKDKPFSVQPNLGTKTLDFDCWKDNPEIKNVYDLTRLLRENK